MPGAGLLDRAKSLRLKKSIPQSSDLGEPDILDSQFPSARSSKNQHIYRRSQQQFPGPSPRPRSPHHDLAKRDLSVRTGYDGDNHDHSDTDSITSGSTAGYKTIPEELIIGLALGSPRENPLPPIPPNSVREDVSSVCSSLGSPIAVRDDSRTDLTLQKGRKWRTFTRLFNKKDASSHFYLLGQNSPRRDLPYQCNTFQKEAPEKFVSQQKAHSTRQNCESGYSSRPPQELDRPLPPMPRRGMFRGKEAGLRRQIGWRNTRFRKEYRRDRRNPAVNKSRSWPIHILRDKIQQTPKNGITARKASFSKFKDDFLLQVEIPSVHMERYSVMFSNLLEPAQPKSISARRKGNLAGINLAANDRYKTKSTRIVRADSDEIEHVPDPISKCAQDIALLESGQPTVSSSRSFSSSNPAARVPLEHNTFCCHTGATSRLPIDPKMETSKPNERDCVLFLDSSPIEPLRKEVNPNRSGSSLVLNRIHPPIAGRYLEQSLDLAEKDKVLPPIPLNPGVRKLPPPGHHEGTPSMSTHSQVRSKEKTVSDAVEISIARQISVSKRQRQLLVPIVSKQARQPMRPKLVIDGGQDAESRKSHYLTVEHT
ncbi:hypothetical protein MMC29_004615 [Sticta canariensis]|nr:hypothetical protein [Sticta canariensis]